MICLVAQSCLTFCNSMDCSPSGSSIHGDSPGKNTRVGCYDLLKGIFPAQGSSPHLLHLLHWQAVSLPLEWVFISSPEDLSNPGIESMSPALAGGFFIPESPVQFSCSIVSDSATPCVQHTMAFLSITNS